MANTLTVINGQILSAAGQPLANVQVAVLIGDINGASNVNAAAQPGSPLATLYGDPQGTNQVPNPTTTDGLGNIASVVNGTQNRGVWVNTSSNKYFVLQVYGPGIPGQQLIPLSVPSAGGGPS